MNMRDDIGIRLAKARGGMVSELPEACWSPAYVLEVKWDGVRQSLEFGETENFLVGRNKHGKLKGVEHAKSQTFVTAGDRAPHLTGLIVPSLAGTMLDGELIWGDDSALALSIEARGKQVFRVFDCLFWKGKDIRSRSWRYRRAKAVRAVKRLRKDCELVTISPIYKAKRSIYDKLMAWGHEGAIFKLKSGIYGTGTYAEGWWKSKSEDPIDAVIVGIEEALSGGSPKRGIKPTPNGRTATLTIAQYDQAGNLVEVGKCRIPPELRDAYAEKLWKEWPACKGQVVECKASGFNRKRYRWLELVRFRTDKPADECLLREEVGSS